MDFTIQFYLYFYSVLLALHYKVKKDEESTHFPPCHCWRLQRDRMHCNIFFHLISPPWKNALTCTKRGGPADSKKQTFHLKQTIEFQLLNSSHSSSCILQILKSLTWTAPVLWISSNIIPKSDRELSLSPWPGSLPLKAISTFKHYTVNQNSAYLHLHSECTECTAFG